LVAAVGSYLDAIKTQGQWRLRIEDVDTPRTVPGMVEWQINALTAYGFVWDGDVERQSTRSAKYQSALDDLIASGSAYPCTCTRSQIAAVPGVRTGVDGLVYPGICAHWTPGDPVPAGAAWRFRVPQGMIGFTDRICGSQQQDLQQDVGDFPLRRADGCYTYQLAVVVDDLAQGVTDVVRGADLMDSTPRQVALIRALGGTVPTYAHLPIVKNSDGDKLSKQTRAGAIPFEDEADRVSQLWQALDFLGQSPPQQLKISDQSTLWAWAKAHWDLQLCGTS
jgi:glutamyl-Q tRNA(Asp) synthetase